MHTPMVFIDLIFVLVVATAAVLFWEASGRLRWMPMLMGGWVLVQSAGAVAGFYSVTDTIPPRFLLLIAPPVVLIAVLFLTVRGRRLMSHFDPERTLYVHSARIGVEIVLYLLAQSRFIPELLTWEGRNMDILIGITAPFVGFFGYRKGVLPRRFLLFWDAAGILCLLNVAYHGILSAPSAFQQFSFDRPNLMPIYFPYVLIPALLVPMMLTAHLITITAYMQRDARMS
ncbi:MAG: hypothetical protein HUU02_16390 [Bacteroidetes bacterium]|nr:hypothetical protein [Bacteroidota bacterium]